VADEASAFSRKIYGKVIFVSTVEEAAVIFKELPPGAKISPDRKVTIPVDEAISMGFLGRENVMGISSQAYLLVCDGMMSAVETDIFDKFFVEVFALPREDEAAWKTERLFSGSATQMCAGGEDSPRYYENVDAVVFKRPEVKLLPVPKDDAISVAKFSELEVGGQVFYTTDFGFGLTPWEGKILAVKEINSSFCPLVMFFAGISSITPSVNDIGVPVYYMKRDAKIPLRLAGFLVVADRGIGAVVPAACILDNIEEFPYVVIE
jgi:hypothetical protein